MKIPGALGVWFERLRERAAEVSSARGVPLSENKSFLPTGVMNIKGNFNRGDVINITNAKNISIGIGVIAYNSSDAKKIIGKNIKDIKNILWYEGRDELIHKDDLVKVKLWTLKIQLKA